MFNLANISEVSKILTNPTWDILVIFFFLAAGFFYGLTSGKKKLLSVLFALYVSALLLPSFPYLDSLIVDKKIMDIFLMKIVAFLALLVFVAILLNKTIFRGKSRKQKWWPVFLLSFLEVGLLMSAIFQLFPARDLFTFSPVIENVFASDNMFFVWAILPLLALFFILKKPKKE